MGQTPVMRIVFRTEGNHQQGMGDVWGSIALADAFDRASNVVHFVISGGAEAAEVIAERSYALTIVPTFADEMGFLSDFRPDIVIVNKLNSDPRYVAALKDGTAFVVTVDDSGDGARYADLNINVLYPIPGCVTGPQFITLREEFQREHENQRLLAQTVRRLLVMQGGADTYGF